jgi:hypothetical protein
MTDSERVQQWNGQKAQGGNTDVSQMQLGSIHTVMALLKESPTGSLTGRGHGVPLV